MRLLVDEDSQAKTLVRLLQEAGHDVLTAQAAGLNSMSDAEILGRAIREGRVLLTRNAGDFLALHRENADHPGILAICQDDDASKSMSYVEIVRAIGNVEKSGMEPAGEFIVLNGWRW